MRKINIRVMAFRIDFWMRVIHRKIITTPAIEWFVAGVIVPLGFAAIAIAGYYLYLIWPFIAISLVSIYFGLGVYSLVGNWLNR